MKQSEDVLKSGKDLSESTLKYSEIEYRKFMAVLESLTSEPIQPGLFDEQKAEKEKM